MHSWRIKLLALLAIFGGLSAGLVAWYLTRGPRQEAPPINLTYRPAKVPGQGMVVAVINTSADQTLEDVIVGVKSPDEPVERTHRLWSKLRPGDTAAVGWVELDGWKLKRGDKVTVRCKGYAFAIEDEVPAR